MKNFSIFILVLLFVTTLPAQNYESLMKLTHTTNNISATVWNDGFIGDNPVDGKSGFFSWKGMDGIWCSGIVYGTSSIGSVNGSFGEGSNYIDDWRNIDSEFSAGFKEETIGELFFNQVSKIKIKDKGVPVQKYGSGFTVIQKTYSNTSEDVIFFRYGFINSTGNDIYDLYVGHTTAWDIGNYLQNSGGIDLGLNLTFVCKSDISGPYFGVVAIDSLYGCKLTNNFPSNLREETFNYISKIDTNIPPISDINTIGGTYIDFIAKDSTTWVTFAYVAGDSLNDLIINAERAIQIAEFAENDGWNDSVTSIDEDNNLVPEKFVLKQNYPNPFNPSTKIKYSIPNGGNENFRSVQLTIYDILGKEVATLINKKQQPGNYKVEWNASNNSSGIYFYTLTTVDFVETKKMILLR